MADELRHDDVVSHENRRETYRLGALMEHTLTGEASLPALCATAAIFNSVCAQAQLDPEATLSQLVDLMAAGKMFVPQFECDQLAPWIKQRH